MHKKTFDEWLETPVSNQKPFPSSVLLQRSATAWKQSLRCFNQVLSYHLPAALVREASNFLEIPKSLLYHFLLKRTTMPERIFYFNWTTWFLQKRIDDTLTIKDVLESTYPHFPSVCGWTALVCDGHRRWTILFRDEFVQVTFPESDGQVILHHIRDQTVVSRSSLAHCNTFFQCICDCLNRE